MTRSISFGLAGLTVALSAQSSMAQAFQKLDAAQLRETLFGVRLVGEIARSGIAWSECIAPDGKAVSKYEGQSETGILTISDASRACFTYSGAPSCFDVYRSGERLLLSGVSDFAVHSIETGVLSCQVGEPLG